MSTLIALLLCFFGLLLLRVGWRRTSRRYRLAKALGWGLLSVATYLSMQVWGAEFGLSYALAAFSGVALALVGVNSVRRPALQEKASSASVQGTTLAQKCITFLAAGPLAGLASCQFTLLSASALPGNEINSMAIAAVVFPLLWGLLAYMVCVIAKPVNLAIALSTAATVFSFALYV
ncbi:MAG: hypothetical protein AB8C02_18380 [Halioglobus sp.]